jgi:hypothetical protein
MGWNRNQMHSADAAKVLLAACTMNKLGLLGLAVQYLPRIIQIRRRTWIGLGIGLLVLFILALGLVVALFVWLFGQALGLAGSAQELLADPELGVMQQLERLFTVAREQLNGLLNGLLDGLLNGHPPAQEDEAEK